MIKTLKTMKSFNVGFKPCKIIAIKNIPMKQRQDTPYVERGSSLIRWNLD